ncbi:hypothetical protein GCM10010169_51090 [Micromonospora fulviviridis]|uniref:hypothetical protein n=1 Tax=Micromonospora fulviviridis TaxID=47860 RepID=UPI0019BD3EF7|nr:hypothetical protein [Micromonospora fulviviridis]GGS00144.1 hypothetical protein GCM10010169_51090 [Micromonospora fulviviridis]
MHAQNEREPGSIRSIALVGMGAATGKVPPRVCANLMWTGYTLFHDHYFRDYDELRATILAQLDDIDERPEEERVRLTVPARPGPRRR